MNAAASILYNLLRPRPSRWRPVLAVHYLTYACRFRCPYCSDGAGRPYWSLATPTLPAPRALELLARIRRSTAHLVLTGGEPVLHPGFGEVMRGLAPLGFRTVILTTSGHEIEPVLDEALSRLTHLVFSLDTLDPAKADRWLGAGPGTHARILANIERAAAAPRRRCRITISSVVTPDNLEDLQEVYRYAREHGFRFAACPQLLGVRSHPALRGHPAYRALFDRLIEEKKRGAEIEGTVDYLEHMRDLRRFRCRPFTMLVVEPTGDVLYPCLEIGHRAGNLLDEPDLDALKRAGEARFGPQPDCPNQCHSACALGFARILSNPASLLDEGFRRVRGLLRRAPSQKLSPRGTGRTIS
jgi:MoaA/NifB/PqqE/SkfB family radical SAM enzyme